MNIHVFATFVNGILKGCLTEIILPTFHQKMAYLGKIIDVLSSTHGSSFSQGFVMVNLSSTVQ